MLSLKICGDYEHLTIEHTRSISIYAMREKKNKIWEETERKEKEQAKATECKEEKKTMDKINLNGTRPFNISHDIVCMFVFSRSSALFVTVHTSGLIFSINAYSMEQ